ncbi:MAG: hypothetical protein LBQ82_01265 [Treponema sp.]|jgi:hypothetical protein|nr:hypothetical protein [Treponema sp.]
MGVIKTALEIAFEKTENVKSDRSSIDLFEAKQQGKKIANAFLAGEDEMTIQKMTDEIKNAPSSQRESLKQGIFSVLVSQIALPAGKEDEKRFEAVGKGLEAIIKNSGFSAMYKQLTQLFSQYLQEMAHYDQAIRQQYAPKLRQKEEELSRRLGREVRIDPLQDPEFIAFYNQHMTALKGNYEAVIEQAKEEARRFFEE